MLIYPEDKFKSGWDMVMTIVLLVTCIETPLDIAFSSDEPMPILDNPLKLVIDLLFLADIIIIFNTAYYTEDMELIDRRKKICIKYITGWFFIDFMSIIPFDTILSST